MSSITLRWLLICFLLLLIGEAHAEGNCPPGQYPIGTPQGQIGPQGCAPIPGYNQQQAQPQPPPERWVDQWGAIATDGPGGHFGADTSSQSQAVAEQIAVSRCKINGGSICEVEISYRNGCAAMVVGHLQHSSNSAPTQNEAVHTGMKVCTDAGDTNCHVYYSDCSPPLRIQ